MIFSDAVNIAEDLARAQTEGGLDALTSFREIPPIGEVAEVPLISGVIPSTDDAATTPSDPSQEFTDHIPTDEVDEIPLPAVTDSEPPLPEDFDEESSDEEVVPEEEIHDPTLTELPASPEIPVPELPSIISTEHPPSRNISDEKAPETTDHSEPAQSIHEALEHSSTVGVPPSADEDEDVEKDEEEPTSTSEPSDLEMKDDDDYDSDEDGSQPADEPEAES